MESKINPGEYSGKIANYGIKYTKDNLPQMMIVFEVNIGEGKRTLTWYGTFKEGPGRKITLDALLTCGLKNNEPAALADGKVSGLLDLNKELILTLDYEKNLDGKEVLKIKWINQPGGRAFAELVPKAEVAGFLNSLRGEIMERRMETGIKAPPPLKNAAPVAAQQHAPMPDDDDFNPGF